MQLVTPRSLARLIGSHPPGVLWFHLWYEIKLQAARIKRPARSLIQPNTLYLETGSYCGSNCKDCYIPARDRTTRICLSQEALERLMKQCRGLPLDYVCIVGGEPLDSSVLETNLQLVRNHPAARFLICTSGNRTIPAAKMRQLAACANLSMVFSIDGFEKTHDFLRGSGSHARACESLINWRDMGGGPAGISVTLSGDNWEETTSPAFVQAACDMGCRFLSYDPCFLPAERGTFDSRDYTQALRRLMEISKKLPAQLFAPPFGQVFGRRLRPSQRMHTLSIDYHGNIRTSRRGPVCGNIHADELLEIVQSPRLQAAYRHSPEWLDSTEGDPRAALYRATFRDLQRDTVFE